jgi:hypothetical protein
MARNVGDRYACEKCGAQLVYEKACPMPRHGKPFRNLLRGADEAGGRRRRRQIRPSVLSPLSQQST